MWRRRALDVGVRPRIRGTSRASAGGEGAASCGAEPDVRTLNKAIAASARATKWVQALHLFASAQQLQPTIHTYGSVLTACDRGSKWQACLYTLASMRGAYVQPDTICFNIAISSCSAARRWDRALSLLDAMACEAVPIDVISFNSAIKACEAFDTWQFAAALLESMVLARLRPTPITFGSLINSCEKNGAWEQCIAYLEVAAKHVALADALSFSSAMRACARRSRWPRGLLLFGTMTDSIVLPDLAAYNVTVSTCERASWWQGALNWITMAQHAGCEPDLITWNAAISSCSKGTVWERSVALLAGLVHGALRPDYISFCAAVSACERGAAWQTALALLDRMEVAGLQPDPVCAMAALGAVLAAAPRAARSRPFLAAVGYLHTSLRSMLAAYAATESRQEAATQLVSGVEVLQRLGPGARVPEDIKNSFEVKVFRPVVDRLQKMVLGPGETVLGPGEVFGGDQVLGSRGGSRRPSERGWRRGHTMNDERLQEQFGLGSSYTHRALRELDLAGPARSRSCTAGRRRRKRRALWAKLGLRRALERLRLHGLALDMNGNLDVPARPIAQHLVVWVAYRIIVGGGGWRRGTAALPGLVNFGEAVRVGDRHGLLELSGTRERLLRRKASGTSKGGLDEADADTMPALKAIFVEHDRSRHAERLALVAISKLIVQHLASEVPSAKISARTSPASGYVRLVGTHTPCISCLAVFCQFRAAYPDIKLQVDYLPWSETRVRLIGSTLQGPRRRHRSTQHRALHGRDFATG